MYFNVLGLPGELACGLEELYDLLGALEGGGPVIEAVPCGRGLSVTKSRDKIVIKYSSKVQFFRAMSYVSQYRDTTEFSISEEPVFDSVTAMFDCSRNGVLTVETVKRLIRHMALMGLNRLMLYTEDTMQVKEYNQLGYFRGAYAAGELKELSRYADALGIEIVPCVQTLAHMAAVLRWEQYAEIKDAGDVLLAGEDKTYDFIESIIRTARECFLSNHIHIGLDEAMLLGTGRYRKLNGERDKTDIMFEHISRVLDICRKYSFRPMMWSDMFIRAAYEGEYHEAADLGDVPLKIIAKTPKDVTLIYWEYFKTDKAHYAKMLDKHKQFGNEVAFAGSAFRQAGYAPIQRYSLEASKAALASCRDKGVRHVMVTVWGDGGCEAPAMAMLPSLQYFAESCYRPEAGDQALSMRFFACCRGRLEDFMTLDLPNIMPENAGRLETFTPSKYMVFNDAMQGLTDRNVTHRLHARTYRRYARRVADCARRNPEWAYMFRTSAALCRLLELKCDIGIDIKAAYDAADRERLYACVKTLKKLRRRMDRFLDEVRAQWLTENKVFGLDVHDIRLGGARERITHAIKRLQEYLDGVLDRLEELEVERLDYRGRDMRGIDDPGLSVTAWHLISTASVLI